jgi:hypothetical protein
MSAKTLPRVRPETAYPSLADCLLGRVPSTGTGSGGEGEPPLDPASIFITELAEPYISEDSLDNYVTEG